MQSFLAPHTAKKAGFVSMFTAVRNAAAPPARACLVVTHAVEIRLAGGHGFGHVTKCCRRCRQPHCVGRGTASSGHPNHVPVPRDDPLRSASRATIVCRAVTAFADTGRTRV